MGSSTTMDTLPDFINWPEEENQKLSSRAAKRQRKTQCKQVNNQTMVEVESDSSNRQHHLSSTTIQENKQSNLTEKPRQLSDNTATENQQQKEDIELDSSDDEVKKGRSQGGSGLSSDDLDLVVEMMIHCSSNQEFNLATSGDKFDEQQEKSQGGKQIINDVQFNSSSSSTNHSSSGAAENQSLNQTVKEIQQPQQPAMQNSRPSNSSPTPEPNDQYAIMASLEQQQPPPSSQQQAKDTDSIDAR